jgi:recombination protein RecA
MNSIDKINKSAGKKIVFMGNEREHVEPLSTGIESLDVALSIGGLPIGRVSEIFGQPGSGKTSFALYMIGVQQALGKRCVFVDAEHALDLDFAAKLGVDTDNLILVQGETGEENLEAIESLIANEDVDFVVVDSVPSLVPKAEIEAEINRPQMGGQARLIASGLRRLVPLVAKNNCVLLFINQQRMNILGGQYNPFTTPGGMSLRFYTSVRMEVKRGDAISISGGKNIDGYQLKFFLRKNKVGKPKADAVLADFLFDSGFSSEADIVAAGISKGIIRREKTTYYFEDIKLGIGQPKVKTYLQENPDLREKILELLKA